VCLVPAAAGDYTMQMIVIAQHLYYPPREAQQIQWLQNFGTKITGCAADLTVTTQRAADIVADARWLVYILCSWIPAVRTWRQACPQAAACPRPTGRARRPAGLIRLCPFLRTAPPVVRAAGRDAHPTWASGPAAHLTRRAGRSMAALFTSRSPFRVKNQCPR
jgi:hypothetical protein